MTQQAMTDCMREAFPISREAYRAGMVFAVRAFTSLTKLDNERQVLPTSPEASSDCAVCTLSSRLWPGADSQHRIGQTIQLTRCSLGTQRPAEAHDRTAEYRRLR
jgi:hypothetical protein